MQHSIPLLWKSLHRGNKIQSELLYYDGSQSSGCNINYINIIMIKLFIHKA